MNADVRSAYRRLWRAGHFAVQNRVPQRYTIRDKLRYAFRTETVMPTAQEIDLTEQFLRTAGRRRGLEAAVIRNLCHVDYSRGLRFFQ
jgi:hypothetical protein